MFDNLTKRITGTLKRLSGVGRVSAKQISRAMDDIESALLDADVGYDVATKIRKNIEKKALGAEVLDSLKPTDMIVKIVHDELVNILRSADSGFKFNTKPPAVFMLVGLQGSGKTTSAAKIATYLQKKCKKRVMLVSTDVVRHAAIEQLEVLASTVGVDFFASNALQKPLQIALDALAYATKHLIDVLIIDTAGRREIDEAMMEEVSVIASNVKPIETLFVADGMLGQVATKTVKEFNDRLDLTGIVLTKMDGDVRGGAALSIKDVTGKPIKFMGVGEKPDAYDTFDAERIAGKILGMGDIVSLVSEMQDKVNVKDAEKIAENIAAGKFDLNDFALQLEQMKNIGVESLLDKMPGAMNIPEGAAKKIDDAKIIKMKSIISSMTQEEKKNPQKVIKSGSRKRRIVAGSGSSLVELNKLLKQFFQLKSMMDKMSGGGAMGGMMRKMMSKMGGGLPPM
jgi:signal recognition particle subunit SRP54